MKKRFLAVLTMGVLSAAMLIGCATVKIENNLAPKVEEVVEEVKEEITEVTEIPEEKEDNTGDEAADYDLTGVYQYSYTEEIAAAAFAGEMLSIKPVISVIDGIISLIGKARGSKNANNFLRKCVENSNGIDFDMPFCVAYSGLSDHLLVKYIEDSADIWQGKTDSVPKHSVGAVIGTHAGPNAIGVAFFEKGQL